MQVEHVYLSGLSFFGLTSKTTRPFILNVYDQIHDIVFHSKGGYNWDTIYNFPVWFRRRIKDRIQGHYDDKTESNNAQNDLASGPAPLVTAEGNVNKQGFSTSEIPMKQTPSKPVKYN